MKRSIFAFLVLLGALVISIASPLIYDRYVDDTECCSIGDAVDSVSVDWAVAQVMNPVFMNIDEVLTYQEDQLEDRNIDSVFLSIPKEVLVDISKVLIGRSSRATKFSIVEEYKKLSEYIQIPCYKPCHDYTYDWRHNKTPAIKSK
jgi:hypothetical protein